jgi:predicted alpha/beta hydrolase family esterase
MGHSLGGITLAMIAENIENPENHKFVLIAPATKTTTTFDNYFSMMHFSDAIKTAFFEEISNIELIFKIFNFVILLILKLNHKK